MDFKTFQECRQADGWQPIRVHSHTTKEIYTVLVNPWGYIEENICGCKGYEYTGHCHHQQEASDRVCRWIEESSEEFQSVGQRAAMICPRCGGPTKWAFEVKE